ncbi:MAG: SxtJ family membrane protein [Desulfuromonadales bacterium]
MAFLIRDISVSQCKDSGLALVLISLISALAFSPAYFLPVGIVFLLVTMTFPKIYKPFAMVWFGFSHALGTVVSRLLLTLLFYLLVTPVGLVRRILGKDAMQVKSWKKGQASVFQNRDHLFKREDLDHPY